MLGLENKPGASVTSAKSCLEKGENEDCDVEGETL